MWFKLVAADSESLSVRAQEEALAQALKTKNKAVLSILTDHDFRASWTEGSVERTSTIEEHRNDWIDDVIHLRIGSYKATISDVRLINLKGTDAAATAIVTLDEFWVLDSTRGRRLEKHFLTTDFWFKLQGTWKLTQRECRSSPR